MARKRPIESPPSIAESLEITGDFLRRIREAHAIANDDSLPLWQRVTRALQAFDGQTLTGLHRGFRRVFETSLVAVNRIAADYELETLEDYQSVSEEDLQRILDLIGELASKVTDSR